MKINNKLISSLDSFRVNFDFVEVWNKRDIAIRDLSPNLIYYSEKDNIYLYRAFSEPSALKMNGTTFVFEDGHTLNIDLSPDEIMYVSSLKDEIKIQAIAIYKLAQQSIDRELSQLASPTISESNTEIILRQGSSIICEAYINPNSNSLSHKIIRIDAYSSKNCKVGPYLMKPGTATYGVFCGNSLVAVAPPNAQNEAFYMEFVNDGEKLSLVVTDVSSGTVVSKYANVHFYTLIGNNDFAVVEGRSVSCFVNEDLNNRLRQNVVKVKAPQIVICSNDCLLITYKNGTTLELTI